MTGETELQSIQTVGSAVVQFIRGQEQECF